MGGASLHTSPDVPIFVGSFDIVVMQQTTPKVTDFASRRSGSEGVEQWVLGWQFAAGERIQSPSDVFGDDGIYNVALAPDQAATPAATASTAASSAAAAAQAQQRVAVFSNSSLSGPDAEATFSFVGRKTLDTAPNPSAPFKVAPPVFLFLNNHYCWPLFNPSPGATAAAAAAAAASAASPATTTSSSQGPAAALAANTAGSITPVFGGQQQQQQQQQAGELWEVAQPQLPPDQMPRQLLVEYLPVEFTPSDDNPALFAKTLTQFYFKITNPAPAAADAAPVYLDRLLLQYWFHGPEEGPPTADSTDSSNSTSSSSSNDSPMAALAASQFRMTCNDASPEVGCGPIAWNVSVGLPNVFGARYVLNIWVPPVPSSSNSTNNSTTHFLLLPNGTNTNTSSSAASVYSPRHPSSTGADGSLRGQHLVQPIAYFEAIVVLESRRFFANISARDDYSFMDTPLEAQAANNTSNASSSSGGDSGQLIRRKREPNLHLPLYLDSGLAWGSPPVAGPKVLRGVNGSASSLPSGDASSSSSNSTASLPPGSYCQQGPNGNQICGIDMLYCCFGSGPLSSTVPADWQQRLEAAAAIDGGDSAAGKTNASSNADNGSDAGAATAALPLPSSLDNTSHNSSAAESSAALKANNAAQVGPAAAAAKDPLPDFALALVVALPVLLVGSALALLVFRRRSSREVGRKPSDGSSSSSTQDKGSHLSLSWNGAGDDPGGALVVKPLPVGGSNGGFAGSGIGGSGSNSSSSCWGGLGRVRSSGPSILRSLLNGTESYSSEHVLSMDVEAAAAAAAAASASTHTQSSGGSSRSNSSWRCWEMSFSASSGIPDNRAAVQAAAGKTAALMVHCSQQPLNGFASQQEQHLQPPAVHLASLSRIVVPTEDAGKAFRQGGSSSSGNSNRTAQQLQAAGTDDCSDFSFAPGHQQQQDQQQEPAPLLQAAGDPAMHRLLRPKRGNSMPAGVMERALLQLLPGQQQPQQQHLSQQQQQQQQQQPQIQIDSNNRGRSSSTCPGQVLEPNNPLCRRASWSGRLHEDAFGADLLDKLLNVHHAALDFNPAAALPAAPAQADGAEQQEQQQPQQQQTSTAGPAAAAVEAAVAAINAAIRAAGGASPAATGGVAAHTAAAAAAAPGGHGRPHAGAQQLLHPSSSSSSSPHHSAPSFYKALMASGGVISPPNGPPIPLNVDFEREIQPHLGRLLGKGGFGHVYEGLWRGQKVAVKLLCVDTDDPAVLDAFLKEVALCACLRGCDRVVRLLGACLGGISQPAAAVTALQQAPSAAAPAVPPGPSAGPAAASAGTGAGAGAASVGLLGTGLAAVGPAVSFSATAGAAAPAGPDAPFSRASASHSVAADGFQGAATAASVAPATTVSGTASNGQAQQQHHQQQLALIMELVEGGNLAQRIYNPNMRRLTYLELLQIGLDVAYGLSYLHPAVIHRDLKPQNVLLDKHGRAKIADFGISRFKDPHRSYLSVTHQGGTPNYMAPELFNGTRVDEAADVYSLGCILYECLSRRQPFGHLAADAKSFNVLFKIIVAVAINKERPLLPLDAPPHLADLITRCWAENPGARPAVTQLRQELEEMMQAELQLQSEKLSRLRRLSNRSRSQSLPSSSSTDKLGGSKAGSSDPYVSIGSNIINSSADGDGSGSSSTSRRSSGSSSDPSAGVAYGAAAAGGISPVHHAAVLPEMTAITSPASHAVYASSSNSSSSSSSVYFSSGLFSAPQQQQQQQQNFPGVSTAVKESAAVKEAGLCISAASTISSFVSAVSDSEPASPSAATAAAAAAAAAVAADTSSAVASAQRLQSPFRADAAMLQQQLGVPVAAGAATMGATSPRQLPNCDGSFSLESADSCSSSSSNSNNIATTTSSTTPSSNSSSSNFVNNYAASPSVLSSPAGKPSAVVAVSNRPSLGPAAPPTPGISSGRPPRKPSLALSLMSEGTVRFPGGCTQYGPACSGCSGCYSSYNGVPSLTTGGLGAAASGWHLSQPAGADLLHHPQVAGLWPEQQQQQQESRDAATTSASIDVRSSAVSSASTAVYVSTGSSAFCVDGEGSSSGNYGSSHSTLLSSAMSHQSAAGAAAHSSHPGGLAAASGLVRSLDDSISLQRKVSFAVLPEVLH